MDLLLTFEKPLCTNSQYVLQDQSPQRPSCWNRVDSSRSLKPAHIGTMRTLVASISVCTHSFCIIKPSDSDQMVSADQLSSMITMRRLRMMRKSFWLFLTYTTIKHPVSSTTISHQTTRILMVARSQFRNLFCSTKPKISRSQSRRARPTSSALSIWEPWHLNGCNSMSTIWP